MAEVVKLDAKKLPGAKITSFDSTSPNEIDFDEVILQNVKLENVSYDSDTVTVTADETATISSNTYYETVVTSSGDGVGQLALTDGDFIGQRKLVTFGTKTGGSDAVDFELGNLKGVSGATLTDLAMDAANEFVLFEWTGFGAAAAWCVVGHNATYST